MDSIWDFLVRLFFTTDTSVLRADPGTIILAGTALYGAIEGQDQARRANKARKEADEDKKARERELADEAAAKEAARKKAESAGTRAGFGGGDSGTRASFTSAAQAGATGFNNVAEDNISKGTLFGN